MRRLALLALALAAAGSVSCGYALVGTGRGSLPENVKTVYVATFVNETTKVGLEQRITEAVLRELAGRGRLKPVNDRDKADSVLSAKLASYAVEPVRFDASGRALEYQIAVVAKVSLLDRTTEKPLYEDPSFLYRQPYTVPATTGGYFDVETAAVETLARPFARSLVTTILEGF
ncbi:MAG TPA: LptE family protein [Thermoanaerobaculia bacterium]|nr:LptE family protein [Thermoanaerobaculia bacterium]